jgi:hypothetical protein
MAITKPGAIGAAPLEAGAFSGGWRRPAFLLRDAKPDRWRPGGGKKLAAAVAAR